MTIKKYGLFLVAITGAAFIFLGCDKSKTTNNSEELKKTKEQLATAEKNHKASEFKSSELSQEVGKLNTKIKSLEAELAAAKRTDPNNQRIKDLEADLEDLKKNRSEKLEDLSAVTETYFGVRATNKNEFYLDLDIAQHDGNDHNAEYPTYELKPYDDYEKMLKTIPLKAKLSTNDERTFAVEGDDYAPVCEKANEQTDRHCKQYYATIDSPMTFQITESNPTSLFYYLKKEPVSVSRLGLVQDASSATELTKIATLDFTKDLTFYFYQANPKKFKKPLCDLVIADIKQTDRYFDGISLLGGEHVTPTYDNNHLIITLPAAKIKEAICDDDKIWKTWNSQNIQLRVDCSEASTFFRIEGSDVHLYTVEVLHALSYPIQKTYSASDFSKLCPSS